MASLKPSRSGSAASPVGVVPRGWRAAERPGRELLDGVALRLISYDGSTR